MKTFEVQADDGTVLEVQANSLAEAAAAARTMTAEQIRNKAAARKATEGNRATFEQLMDKARELDAAGDTESARRLARIASERRNERSQEVQSSVDDVRRAAAARRDAQQGGAVPTFDQSGFQRQRAAELIGPGQAALQGAAKVSPSARLMRLRGWFKALSPQRQTGTRAAR